MSFRVPQFSKPDTNTAMIVEELRARGYTVEYHGKADILVTHHGWIPNLWRKIEVKKPKGKKQTLKLRTDQQEQQSYCAEHGIPYVLNAEQAVAYLTGLEIKRG